MVTASFAGDNQYQASNGSSSGTINPIEPSISYENFTPTDDAWVSSGFPNTNYGTIYNMYNGWSPSYGAQRNYLKFDLGEIPSNATIISAILKLNSRYGPSAGPSYTDTWHLIDAHPVNNDDWSENTLTWNNAPPMDPTVLDTENFRGDFWAGSYAWCYWDVKTHVENQIAGGNGIISIGLQGQNENVYESSGWFYTKDSGSSYVQYWPHLEVSWMEAPATSTTLSISPSTFTLYPGENQTFIATLRDENNNALANKTITWSATAGSLSASSGTTNSSGWTSVIYMAPQVTSQTAVTVSAYFGGDSQYQASYDSSDGTVLPQSSMQPTSLSIFPQYFTLFPGYSGQVQSLIVTLRDNNNNPLPNKTITCSATWGSVNPSSGTTDALGQFSAVYTAPTVTAETSTTITMSFAGDDQYGPSSTTSSGIPAMPIIQNISASTGGTVVINVIGTDVTINVLAVPPNSLHENTPITVLQVPPENVATYTMMSNIFDIGPNGTNFTNPVMLTLPYQLQAGVSEDNLAIYYYNTDTGSWERVGGNVNKVDKTVSVLVNHLSKYAVMAELAATPQVEGGIPLIAVVLAVLCVSAAAAASSAWIYLQRTRGEAASELIEHGLSSMKLQEVDIFREIRSRKEFIIPELMQKTGASMTVVWRTVQKLINKGLVQPTKKTVASTTGRGKPSTVYKYVSD